MNPPHNNHSVKGGWLFLALVVSLYGITSIVDPTLAHQSLISFVHTADQIIPALVLVFVLIFITTFALNPQNRRPYLDAHCGLKGWLIAIGSGILAAGPVYTWYAVLADLRRQGVRPALIATFLYSRAIKLPLLRLMIHYFGIGFTALLCACLIGLAIVNGLVMQRLVDSGFVSATAEEMQP